MEQEIIAEDHFSYTGAAILVHIQIQTTVKFFVGLFFYSFIPIFILSTHNNLKHTVSSNPEVFLRAIKVL